MSYNHMNRMQNRVKLCSLDIDVGIRIFKSDIGIKFRRLGNEKLEVFLLRLKIREPQNSESKFEH